MARWPSGFIFLVSFFTHGAMAVQYPARPIRLIVPSGTGGGADYPARAVAAELSTQMGQQVVVDNRPGAGGLIGMEAVARSAPDGYTLGMGNVPTLSVQPLLKSKLPYDVERDLQPIARTTDSQNVLVIRPGLPVKSVPELIDYARKNAGKLTFASTGNGSVIHLAGELFKQRTGAQILHVPYKAISQAHTELFGGLVDVIFDNLTPMVPHIKSGKLRGLAVTGPARTPLFPELPTVAEAGVPGYEVTVWTGIVAPAGLPKPILARLNVEINKACVAPALLERYAQVGNRCPGGTPEQFRDFCRLETVKWAQVIKTAGIKVD